MTETKTKTVPVEPTREMIISALASALEAALERMEFESPRSEHGFDDEIAQAEQALSMLSAAPSPLVGREELARAIRDADASFFDSAFTEIQIVDGAKIYRFSIDGETFDFVDTEEATAFVQYEAKVSHEHDKRRADAILSLINGGK